MAKDLYKAIAEKHQINKNERRDVKLGAVAVLAGAELTGQQKDQLHLDNHPEWRSLLGWQKKLLTEALVNWLKSQRCDAILQKIDSMGEDDRHKFLSEAIRTKIKSPTRPRLPTGTSDADDVKDDGRGSESGFEGQFDSVVRTPPRALSISHVLNPE